MGESTCYLTLFSHTALPSETHLVNKGHPSSQNSTPDWNCCSLYMLISFCCTHIVSHINLSCLVILLMPPYHLSNDTRLCQKQDKDDGTKAVMIEVGISLSLSMIICKCCLSLLIWNPVMIDIVHVRFILKSIKWKGKTEWSRTWRRAARTFIRSSAAAGRGRRDYFFFFGLRLLFHTRSPLFPSPHLRSPNERFFWSRWQNLTAKTSLGNKVRSDMGARIQQRRSS